MIESRFDTFSGSFTNVINPYLRYFYLMFQADVKYYFHSVQIRGAIVVVIWVYDIQNWYDLWELL